MRGPLTYLLGTHPCASETFIQREIDALRRRGWRLAVASLQGASALPPARAAAPGIAAALRHILPLLCRRPQAAWHVLHHLPQGAALEHQVRASGARAIHAQFAWIPADIAQLAALRAGVPFTCSVHAWDVFAQPPTAIRHRLARAAAVCACTQAATHAVRMAGIDGARIHLVRHGLPLAEYPFTASRSDGRILAVGRLEPKKGFDLLVAACARLRVPFTCRIIGAGPQRRRLARLIAAAGLEGRVTLTGAASPDDVRAAMREASVLALPSRRLASGDRDGMANVLTEAMALGTPVVTTTAGAAGEILQESVNGRLVAPEDPNALADAIGALLGDATARARLAAAARATVEQEFDETITISRLEEVFERVLAP